MKARRGLMGVLLEGRRVKYGAALLFAALGALISMLPPLVVRLTVDSVIGETPFALPESLLALLSGAGGRPFLLHNLWLLAAVLVAVELVNGMTAYARARWAAEASQDIARDLRERLYDRLQRAPYEEHVKAETGDWLQRCTSDVETIRNFLAAQVVEAGRIVALLFFAALVMAAIDMTMMLVAMAVIPLLVAFSYVYYVMVQRRFLAADEAEGRMSAMLQENLTGIRVVRAFGQQKNQSEAFGALSREYRDLWRKLMNLLAAYWGVSDMMIYGQMVVTVGVGVARTVQGDMSVGTLIVFISYSTMLLFPARQLGRMLADMGKCKVSLGRVAELLDKPIEQDAPETVAPPHEASVDFEHVSLCYDDGREVLQGITLHVDAGETVAFLGPAGSGKSSLVHLLQRLYDPTEGIIRIGGVDIAKMKREDLRRAVGIVLQEPFLYSRSIKDNLLITNPGAGDEALREAVRAAALDEVIAEFDKGFDTMVGERGVTLSGGQKQRVAIARMLLQHTPILIFDDSLSSLDAKTDTAIRQALQERRKGCTTFLISHRIMTLSEADRIYVLDAGRLVQAGTHEELIAMDGLYRRIWEIQGQLAVAEEGGRQA